MIVAPTGFQILIELRKIEETIDEGPLAGFVKNASGFENEREQDGEPMGTVIDFGPCAFDGFQGCDAKTAEERAKQWGIQKGDMVIFSRYAGMIPYDFKKIESVSRYRFVPDKEIIGKVEGFE